MNFYRYLKILDPMVILIRNMRYCVFVYVYHDIIWNSWRLSHVWQNMP